MNFGRENNEDEEKNKMNFRTRSREGNRNELWVPERKTMDLLEKRVRDKTKIYLWRVNG